MIFSKGLKNEFETAVVYEPSVFEPLKFYCMWPDRVSNPGPLTYESGAIPTALCGPVNTGGSATVLPVHLYVVTHH